MLDKMTNDAFALILTDDKTNVVYGPKVELVTKLMQIQLYISHREGSVKNLNFSQAFHLPAIQNEGDFLRRSN